MSVVHTLVLLAASSTSTKKSTSSSSSITFILFLLIIGVVGYFFLLRPQQQKARKQREAQSDIQVGDEVLTVGGIIGTVLDINSERVTIITGAEEAGLDGSGGQPHRMVLVRNAIARKIEPTTAAPPYDDVEAEDEADEYEPEQEEAGGEDHEEVPRYEYHPEDDEAEANGAASDDKGPTRNGRRRRRGGTNGVNKADTGTGEESGP